MGSHPLSIRLRIYLLLAVPLLTVIALYAFVVTTTVGDALNLDRGPSLINATSVPTATFDTYIQAERRASLVYLADPTAANRMSLLAAQTAAIKAFPVLRAKLTSPATTRNATTGETRVIRKLLSDVGVLAQVRAMVDARAISPAKAFGAYNAIMADQFSLFLQEIASLTNATATGQALALVNTVAAREYLLQEDSLVSAALAAGQLAPAARAEITQLAGARQSAFANGMAGFDPRDLAIFKGQLNRYAPAATQSQLTALEDVIAVSHGIRPPFTTAQWAPVVTAVSAGYFAGGLRTAEAQVIYDHQITRAAWERVALAGGLGLAGLVGAIILSGLAGRRIIRRLADLGQAALTLANQQLPDVVARLRRGEEVAEIEAAPPVRPGTDEIGQVGQAFEVARRTAIQAAVDEARLRRGINDVFRNIARRGQSLLHRQLAMLDAMERRITDPELLDDLFRLDHLTTRMRRHAEGLIILSGAPPGRGWRNPVQLVDVLRAAAAEVEDYARVGVMCASRAALTGAAVADVIHLLAELIENATMLSPPFAPVSVTGSLVAKGFGIEIEDRGLGMSEQRLAELNGRLARPPEFNPSDSEQLGLFVVSQLAKRHGIQVSLHPSPLGGTKAIVLIPASLIVLGEDYEESSAEPCTVTWVSVQAAALSSLDGGQVAGALTQATLGSLEGRGPVSLAAQAVDFARSVPKAEPFDVFAPLSRDKVVPPAGPAMISAAWPQPPGPPGPVPHSEATYVALPRRIKQASLAPHLREDHRMSRQSAPPGDSPEHVADGRSPEQIRSTLSAMQRGWEQGRGLWDAGTSPLEDPGGSDGS